MLCWRLFRKLQLPGPPLPFPLSPVCSLPCTHLKDQFYDLRMYHTMHRLPVHVGDEVSGTEPCLLGWAPLLHVLGAGHHTGRVNRISNEEAP